MAVASDPDDDEVLHAAGDGQDLGQGLLLWSSTFNLPNHSS